MAQTQAWVSHLHGSLLHGQIYYKTTYLCQETMLKPRLASYTVGIRLSNMSGNQMVETCPMAEWFVN